MLVPDFLLKAVLLALLIIGNQNASAEVWADVSSGATDVFYSNGATSCTDCHDSSLAVGAPRSFAPLGVDFDDYSTTIANGQSILNLASTRVNNGTMPPGPDLSAGRQTAIANWVTDGAPFAAASATSSTITNQQKTSVTLRGTVDTNSGFTGGQWYFEYGLAASVGYNGGQVGTTTRNSTAALAATYSLAGLNCGTNYKYRAVALNGNNTALGGNQPFSSAACTNPIIAGGAASVSPPATNEDTQTSFNLTRTDNDPGTLTWSIFAQGSKGSFSFTTSTTSSPVTVQYVPAANQTGADTAGRIRVTNAATGLSDTIVVNMSITAVNDQPVITSAAPASAVEDVQYSYSVLVNDPDDTFAAGLGIVLTGQPAGMSVNSSTGVITWTPGNNVTTSGLVTVTVTDGGENGTVAAVQQFTVGVTATNDPPVITPGATTSASEDVLYSYQLQVADVDDINDGSNLTFTLFGEPAGMSASSTGLITWTPGEGVLTSNQVTIRVEDGDEDNSVPTVANFGLELFTITVTPVNDSPVVTPGAAIVANENDNYSYAINVFDPDDANDGTSLIFTPSNFPTGMTVSATGVIDWLVPRTGADVTFNNVTVTVTDGGEDGATPSLEVFNLAVSIVDDDNDTVANYEDNCPQIANLGQADLDNDSIRILPQTDPNNYPPQGDIDPTARDAANALGESYLRGGDACDEDIDGDGMRNDFEESFAFLDPLNPADATADEDGDGISNLDEFLSDLAPDTDSVGPVVTAPANITLDATGLLTAVDLGTATGNDGNDGAATLFKAALDLTQADKDALAVASTGCQLFSDYETDIKPFRPGQHIVTWVTCDSSGNSGQDDQVVNINPLASVISGQLVGEGQTTTIYVTLNGNAAIYPATVSYSLTGSATKVDDYDGVDGTVQFNAPGELVKAISFNTIADGETDDDETVRVTLHSPVNLALSNAKTHTVTITEANVAPQVVLNVTQPSAVSDVNKGHTVYTVDGTVTVVANANDANGDTLNFDWSATDEILRSAPGTTISANQIDFDPNDLTVGNFYKLSVTVSDGVAPITIERLLLVKAAEVNVWLLGDDDDGDGVDNLTEGYGDDDADGLPNYLDNLSTPANAIENNTVNLENSQYIETDPGLKISLGETAVAAQAKGVLIGLQDIADYGGAGGTAVTNAATDFTFLSGLLNFEISGLSDNIVSVHVVIPLLSAIQEDAAYRKYNATGWFDFVEDDFNELRSAPGGDGTCPQPDSNLYGPSLTAGHLCLQLTIQDGGANDADGVRNFIVKDPGGLALAAEAEEIIDTSAEQANGRIGSVSFWFMLILLTITTIVWRLRITQMGREKTRIESQN